MSVLSDRWIKKMALEKEMISPFVEKQKAEKNISYEYKTNEIFKASDMMVDSLIRLLERERQKKAS